MGKTYLVRDFANNEYESFVNINLRKQPQLAKIFDGSGDSLVKKITANIRDVNLIPDKTLILLDEIEYAKDIDGLLVQLSKAAGYDFLVVGYPVANISDEASALTLHPLDFEEFLWANGFDEKTTDGLKKRFLRNEPIPLSYHNRLENLFREYIVVGGMPEVVQSFANHRDFAKVDKLQREIMVKYRADIAASNTERRAELIKKCYDSVSKQLSSELKKFKYSRVEKGQTRRKYGTSVDWLIDSGLVIPSYNVPKPSVPLDEHCNKSQFKLYLNDTGLLTSIYGFDVKRHILNNVVKGNVRSAVYENAVAQALTARGYSIYYHKPDDNHEVEFIIEKNGEIIPIEVNGKKTVSVSLSNLISEYALPTSYKLTPSPGEIFNSTRIVPYYNVLFI